MAMPHLIDSGGLRLSGHLARPLSSGTGSLNGLVLCHGFPSGPRGAATSGQTYPQFADRLAAETGWVVLTFNFRGSGTSEGNFSLGGWLADLGAAVDHLSAEPRVNGVWLAGSSTGGALAVCAAAEDERVRGVATLAAPADFDAWAGDARRFLQHARSVGVITSPSFPSDLDAWNRELREIRALTAVTKLAPRPLLVVHGTDDDVVPVSDARALVDAADGPVEMRILVGAGHRLRHDPRAVAILLGWMDRQQL
ncbi:MAG: Alpha/beta hydrolase family [Acidimicrobiales bacterium]|jgi:dipeptidyl aminopeptidase/acylaminoacyl peptidase|nr:Alpha/beta hydrolase family [Acidimicrobiales bacterium]